MKVLHLGANGNLGLRLLPALLSHNHKVIAFVRSPSKLLSLLPPALSSRITILEGNALDSEAVVSALRTHSCEALVSTAGTREPRGGPQTLPRIVASIASAAVIVGKERGRPLRAWFIGGMGSLEYPGTGGYRIQDYMPGWMTEHHKPSEGILKGIGIGELEWSLICVAMMEGEEREEKEEEEEEDEVDFREGGGGGGGGGKGPRGNDLIVGVDSPPGWKDHWVRRVPIVGVYLNLVPVVRSYTAKYEDVADFIAGDVGSGNRKFVGRLVGYKTAGNDKDL